MTRQGKPESDEAGGGSLAGALAGLLDHFFSTIGKHQPGCAIEIPAVPGTKHPGAQLNDTSDVKTGTAQ